MIAPSVVQEVRRLLATGELSQRKIARLTGISRGTVGAIATGKRPDYESIRPAANDEPLWPTGPLQRCPGCGGMVYMPCRLCRVRAAYARSSSRAVPAGLLQAEEPVGLDLKSEHRARYEQIRRQRTARSAMETADEARQHAVQSPPKEDQLLDAFELEDDVWTLDPDALWDALDWETDQPAFEQSDMPPLPRMDGDADDPQWAA